MSRRHRLEELRGRREVFLPSFCQRLLIGGNARSEFRKRCRRRMADRAVIKLRRIVRSPTKTYRHKMGDCHEFFSTTRDRGYNVLMNVVRKDRLKLMRSGCDREGKQRCASRTRTRMTAGTKRRLVSDEEILTMAARTRCVSGKLRDIGKTSGGKPV